MARHRKSSYDNMLWLHPGLAKCNGKENSIKRTARSPSCVVSQMCVLATVATCVVGVNVLAEKKEAAKTARKATGLVIPELAKQTYTIASARALRAMSADEIESMQFFRLDREDGGFKKRFIGKPVSRTAIRGILHLCRQAGEPRRRSRERRKQLRPDYSLVVKPVKGGIFEIRYDSRVSAPFGGLESRELKEAIYAATVSGGYCTAIHFKGNKVVGTTRCAIRAGGRKHGTEHYKVAMRIDERGRLILDLRIKRDGKVIMQGRLPMRYGQAKVFPHDGEGHMIVLLQEPDGY